MMFYEVRYYDPLGHVVKEPYLTVGAAIMRFEKLVMVGHKSVKLKTVIDRPGPQKD